MGKSTTYNGIGRFDLSGIDRKRPGIFPPAEISHLPEKVDRSRGLGPPLFRIVHLERLLATVLRLGVFLKGRLKQQKGRFLKQKL